MTYNIYKVVKITHNRLISVYGSQDIGDIFTIEYEPQVYATPQIGMIFAFDSIESANEDWGFQLSESSERWIQLWRCETTIKPTPCNFQVSIDVGVNKFRRFWEKYPSLSESQKLQLRGMVTPDGTVLCENIKLLEQVKS